MRIIAFILAFCFFTQTIAAQGKAENDTYLKWFLRYRINKTDENKDGKISYAEIAADENKFWRYYLTPTNFEIADRDKSKTLDVNELKAMRYREEGNALQVQADQYDKWLGQFGKEKLGDLNWIKGNTALAAQLLANYEWHQNFPHLFNELSKSSWLGNNSNVLKSINSNYFLLIKKPQLAGTLYNRYPRHSIAFQKDLKNYYKSQIKIKKIDDTKSKKLSPAEVENAKKASKRTIN